MDLVALVKACEGFHRVVRRAEPVTAAPYLCPAGYWTIAWGHLCRPDHPPVGMPEGEAYLARDLAVARGAVLKLIAVPLGPGQLDALTSWTMNLGAGRLRGSTLRAVINRGEHERAPAELRRWVYGGGVKLAGLVLRREAEAAMYAAD